MTNIIRYVRPDDGGNMGGITLVFQLDYSAKTARFGWAVCSKEDNFSKRKGERVAVNRLSEGHSFLYKTPSTKSLTETLEEYLLTVDHPKLNRLRKDFQEYGRCLDRS